MTCKSRGKSKIDIAVEDAKVTWYDSWMAAVSDNHYVHLILDIHIEHILYTYSRYGIPHWKITIRDIDSSLNLLYIEEYIDVINNKQTNKLYSIKKM